ncbi:MAG: HNH endonuclease [Nocardioidaceae bacterium]|nr:HNH endonuclease [Nocardioidaceae bacterium]MDQ3324293.1 HNH endonuclease [Actinomycetota bacterium]
MRAYVGVTDGAWASFLRARPVIAEVNFWQPSTLSAFRALTPGQPFLFKTHWPHNRLVGGFFSGHTNLLLSEAWRLFGEGNGVSSHTAMRAAIARYRREELRPGGDPMIGCILLRDVYFVAEHNEVAAPPDFAKNVARGKVYDLAASSGSYVERALSHLIRRSDMAADLVDGPVFGQPRLVAPRVGQQAFKALVQSAYHRRCAITGARITPTRQAAHIRPVGAGHGGENRVDNGLLLRSDVHTLFDEGYLGIDTSSRLHVSPRLRADFENGSEFYDRAGRTIDLPDARANRPGKEAVTWHMDTVYRSR